MVVLQGDLLERPGSPVRRLAGLLRQHDYKQGLDGYVTRLGGVRFGSHRRVRVYRRASDVAQPLGLPEAIGRLGSLLHLPALRNGQHAIARRAIQSSSNSVREPILQLGSLCVVLVLCTQRDKDLRAAAKNFEFRYFPGNCSKMGWCVSKCSRLSDAN